MGEHSNYLHTIPSSLLAIEMDPSVISHRKTARLLVLFYIDFILLVMHKSERDAVLEY